MSDDTFTRCIATVQKGKGREEVRFGFSEYQGRRFCDVRTYSDMSAGVKSPTKAGLSFAFESLVPMADAMNQLVAEAKAAGLIGGER